MLALAFVLAACADVDERGEALNDAGHERAGGEVLAQQQDGGCEPTGGLLWRLWARWLQIPVTTTCEPSSPGGGMSQPMPPEAPTGPAVGEPIRTVHPHPGQSRRPLTPRSDPSFPELGTDLVDVLHHDLDLRWSVETLRLTGRARLELLTRVELTAIPLDFGQQLEVTEVQVAVDGGAPVPTAAVHFAEKLGIPLPRAVAPNTLVVVTIAYEGEPYPVLTEAPIPVGWTVHDDGAVGTLSEPDAAHEWFPTNDHPTDKATYRSAITVPDYFVAVGNGVQDGAPVRNPDGTVTYRWRMDAPMAPYLTLVAIDELTASDQGVVEGVPLRNFLPRGEEQPYLDALSVQPAALSFLVERLGPFPFKEYGAVVIPGPTVALETQGRSIFQGDSARDPGTVVHELAHQWFGNSVSLTRWQHDIWWVEGFARFSEWLWTERTEGASAYARRVQRAYDGLAWGGTVSLAQAPRGSLFSPGVYDGGAIVFHELRELLGEAQFFAAVRAFCTRFKYGNATTEDLLATFSEFAGRDIGPQIFSWLTGGRPPALTF